MPARRRHLERHRSGRAGWLRAAVLGANDGILSIGGLIMGVSAGRATHGAILLTGVAGVIAGAMSMGAGEYVSVSSQADSQQADLAREAEELRCNPQAERAELAGIWVHRGLDPELARTVADQLMAADALQAHARDELGFSDLAAARPIQAALASAACFSAGAVMPLAVALVSPPAALRVSVAAACLLALAILGAVGARAGGARVVHAVIRVTVWGAVAMAVTSAVGALVGAAV